MLHRELRLLFFLLHASCGYSCLHTPECWSTCHKPSKTLPVPFQILPTSSLSYILTGKREVLKSNLQSKSGHQKSCLPKSPLLLVLHSPLEYNQLTQRQKRIRVQGFNPQQEQKINNNRKKKC